MDVTQAQLSEPRFGIGAAAELAQVHPDTIRRAVKAGRLPFTKTPGGQYRFNRADVLALLSPSSSGDAA